jgi:hypothetical protein
LNQIQIVKRTGGWRYFWKNGDEFRVGRRKKLRKAKTSEAETGSPAPCFCKSGEA